MLPSSPMLRFRFLLLFFWALLVSDGLLETPLTLAASPTEPLNIVVTIPVLKDLAQQVGGPHARATSLLSGYVAVRRARLLFEVGIGLEVWVSSLVKSAGSPSLRVVTTSQGIGLIRDHTGHREGTRQGGETTGSDGNPHIWLDPENVAIMLRHITEALIAADPAHATDFRNRQAIYLHKLDQLRKELSDRVKSLPDRRFIAHHPAWPYMARRFDFDMAATILMQSGAEPSALQLQSLIGK